MSQYPSSFEQPRAVSSGLAVAALVCACLGLCLPVVGLVGLILGIVAVSKASSSPQTHGGMGMGIAGIVVGALSLLTSIAVLFMSAGILLPALGKARDSARQVKSSTQLRQIDLALANYANDNNGWFPPAGADWQSLIAVPSPGVFVSPRDEHATAADSYIYIPGFNLGKINNPGDAVIVYENPKYVTHGTISVGYADGHVVQISPDALKSWLNAMEKPGDEPKPPAAPRSTPPRRRPGSGG